MPVANLSACWDDWNKCPNRQLPRHNSIMKKKKPATKNNSYNLGYSYLHICILAGAVESVHWAEILVLCAVEDNLSNYGDCVCTERIMKTENKSERKQTTTPMGTAPGQGI